MPYDSKVFWDKKMKTWIAEVWEFGSNRVTTGRRKWWGAYDTEQAAKRAATIKKAEAVKNAEEKIRKLAEEARAEREKRGWKARATEAIIKARHGPGRT